MNIRRANENDIPRLIELLEQVLQIHADIRPDIFIPTDEYIKEREKEIVKYDNIWEIIHKDCRYIEMFSGCREYV